jgi:hypothetical protein
VTFAAPSSPTESVKVADLAGQLLIITPVEYKTGIQTVHGEADAVEVNIVNLDKGSEHNNVLFFNVALKNALKTKIGQKVLARIGQGKASPGKSAPWILVDATSDAAAIAKANAYLGAAPSTPAAPAVAAAVGLDDPKVAALLAALQAK